MLSPSDGAHTSLINAHFHLPWALSILHGGDPLTRLLHDGDPRARPKARSTSLEHGHCLLPRPDASRSLDLHALLDAEPPLRAPAHIPHAHDVLDARAPRPEPRARLDKVPPRLRRQRARG